MTKGKDVHQKLPNIGLTNKAVRGTFYQSIKIAVLTIVQLIVVGVLARILEPDDFGLLATSMFAVDLPESFSRAGIHQFLIRQVKIDERYLKAGFTLSLLLNSLIMGLLIGIAPILATLFQIPEAEIVIKAIAPVCILKGLGVVPKALLIREFRFDILAIIEVASYVFGYGLLGISSAFLGFGVWALVVANLGYALLDAIMANAAQPHPKRISTDLGALKDIIRYSFGLSLGGIANHIALRGDYLVVGRSMGAIVLGYYSRAYVLMTQPAILFSRATTQVFFSAVAKVQDNPLRMAKAFQRVIALSALFGLSSSAVIYALSPEIVYTLLGPKWEPVVLPLQILAFGTYLRVGYKVSGVIVKATGAVYRFAWIQTAYAVLVLVGAWGGSYFGIRGVALGVLVALIVQFFLLSALGLKIMLMRWGEFFKVHIPALSLASVVSLICWNMAVFLRGIGNLPAIFVLLGSLGVTLFASSILVYFLPSLFLGNDGLWWFKTLAHRLPLKGSVKGFFKQK